VAGIDGELTDIARPPVPSPLGPLAPRPSPLDVLDGIESLINQSLVRAWEGADGEPRYGMLETIREYARERLAGDPQGGGDEAAALRDRHLAYYLALAEEAEPHLEGPGQARWLARLEAELDNLRAALGWALRRGDVSRGVRLTAALEYFWWVHGHLSEGRQWTERVLAQGAAVPDDARARLLNGLARLVHWQGDLPAARRLLEESHALFQQLAQPWGVAVTLGGLGTIARDQGDYAAAGSLQEESLAIRRQIGDQPGIASSLLNLAIIARQQADEAAARRLLDESLALFRELGDEYGVASSLRNLGILARDRGDAAARPLLEESLALFRELGLRGVSAAALVDLALLTYAEGDAAAAQALARQGLTLYQEVGDRRGIAESLEALAGIAAALGRRAHAARLSGAAAALRANLGIPRRPADAALHARLFPAAPAGHDEAAWAAAWEEGRMMPLERAIAEALE
jgi:hypothetical protein